MLKFYYGTELKYLAGQLVEELKNNPQKNPLKPEVFVVQNHGIGQWLSLHIARKEGIAANMKFEFPSERIWKLIRLINPGIPDMLPSDRQPMTWSLMALLEDEDFLKSFNNLRHYIRGDDSSDKSVRRWKLASKIADVFDQYLIYRPEMILNWEDGRSIPKTEKWQVNLWNRLLNYWKNRFDGKWIHRARLQKELWNKLDEKALSKDKLPDRITVFGISNASPAFIKTLVKLSKLIDIHFYYLTPDHKVTDSEKYENPLLASLGKESADFMAQFYQSAEMHDIELQSISSGDSFSAKDSAFKKVQADLRNNSITDQKLISDRSIQVHSCHSPMREVEVLYDQLLAVLDENPRLNPDDILIMTPDIETYAPMIEAVFEMPDEGQPRIPYSIADRGIRETQSAVQTFLKVIELCESRFKVTDVLDLLDADPVRKNVGFTDDDLNRLERWIEENRIRWGIDAPFKQNVELPESDHFTWRSGLNRMLLGYAMKQEDDLLHRGIFPYHEVETSEDAELVGKFSRFLHLLFNISREAKKYLDPNGWSEYLNQIIDGILPDGKDYFRQVSRIRNTVEQFKETALLGEYDRSVPFRIVRLWLENQLEEQHTGGGRIGRGVTFSSLVPMRSIPFKMIGMIGLNEGAFPRSKIPVEFDLMYLEPQPGDPVRSKEDRHLFLENLLSAESYIYFSYIGQSNREDTDFPPSVVLSEFLDYLSEYYGFGSVVQDHRLQPFSPEYFTENKSLHSFSNTQLNVCRQLIDGKYASQQFIDKKLAEPDSDWRQLSVNDLISFFQHPPKYLFRNRLGIYLREDEVLTEDREPFNLNGLDGYQVGQELLDRYMKEESLDSYREILQSRDMLPEGWSGQQAYQQKAKEVREFGAAITAALNQNSFDDCEVNIEIEDFHIAGSLTGIYENALILYRFGSMRPKDLINLWINHLLFQLVKPETHPGFSCLFTQDAKTSFERYLLSPIENPRSILKELLGIYWDGLQQCIYFFPECSYAFAHEVCCCGGDRESGLKKASRKWDPSYGQYPGEKGDPYNKLIMGRKNPLNISHFTELACEFWNPFFKVLTQEED